MGLETLAIAAPFIWIAAVIAVSILYRLKAGKPIFPRAPKTAVFAEAWVSGRSLKNLLSRMGALGIVSSSMSRTECSRSFRSSLST